MRYNKIRKMDIANGPGVRVSIFMQGCTFNCKNCFNPETHDFLGGKEFTEDTIAHILELCNNDNIEGLSILGGEPMHPNNIEGTTKLAQVFKYIDILVDGQYVDELFNPLLKWRGSSNQRVIDVQKSLKQGEIIKYCD